MIEIFTPQHLARLRRRTWLSLGFSTFVSWAFGAAILCYAFAHEYYEIIFFLLAIFTGFALFVTLDNIRVLNALLGESAASLWATFCREYPRQFGRLLPATHELSKQITRIYKIDSVGYGFPLPQAVRLLDTHQRQQRRLSIIDARWEQNRALYAQVQEKILALESLGEKSSSGERTLAELKLEAVQMKELKTQIESSCRRLELLLLEVEKSVQIKALHQEVASLTESATGVHSKGKLALKSGEDESDLERQITREIETYLQLEREAEAKLKTD